jgi:hypothetical protein
MKTRFKICTVDCPDWLNNVAAFGIPLAYLGLVIWLAITFSLWFLFLLLLSPSTRNLSREEKALRKLKKWQKEHQDDNDKTHAL